MKRIIVITGMALLLVAAVDANAACWVCRFHLGNEFCKLVADGDTGCDDSTGVCVTNNIPCIPLAPDAPLATELTVASVERIDQVNVPKAAQPQIANLEMRDLKTIR